MAPPLSAQKTSIVLGIDPGTRTTGFALIARQMGVFTPLDFGCIRLPQEMPLSKRLHVIYQSLSTLIQQHRPDALAVETQYINKNVDSAMKLGMVRGIAFLAASINGIEAFEYTPSKVKQTATGSGRASKQQVQEMLQRFLALKVPPEPEDASDALAIAFCHLQTACSPIAPLIQR